MMRSLLIAALFCASMSAAACSLEEAASLASDDDVTLFYRLKSPPLALAQHFSLQFRVCRDDRALGVENFRLDASMPAHAHGMNYRARVKAMADGSIEASGLLFHMPGHWQVVVDFEGQGRSHRFTLDYRI